MNECVQIANDFAKEFSQKTNVPCFLYEEAAKREDRRNLADVRRGEYEGLKGEIGKNPDKVPDYGPNKMHPTAGATAVSTADNLMAGRGFVDMLGGPFILWPPLYPLLLAGLSTLTSISTFEAAWYLNVLLFGLNTWLAGWWLYIIFRDRPFYAIAGTIVFVLSRSMLRIHANVASEPLFETCILVFFLAAARYLTRGSPAALWTMCLAAGLGALQRYLGVALLAVAAIVILQRERSRVTPRAILPWIVSAMPLGLWVVLLNLPISGAPFGPRELGAMLPVQNIGLGLTKILWWFAPRWGVLDWLILRPWIPIAVIAVLLAAVNTRQNWLSWLRTLSNPAVWPAMFFGALYFLCSWLSPWSPRIIWISRQTATTSSCWDFSLYFLCQPMRVSQSKIT